MSDGGTNNSDKPELPNNLFGPLFEFLILLAKGLRRQTFIFVLAMAALIILALLICQKIGSFVPMYVVIISLIMLTFMALWAESVSKNKPVTSKVKDKFEPFNVLNHKVKKINFVRDRDMSQFDNLRSWLDQLVDSEFRELILSLLSVRDINHLPKPPEVIDRGAFLGQMKMYNRLAEVEKYLREKYSERFVK